MPLNFELNSIYSHMVLICDRGLPPLPHPHVIHGITYGTGVQCVCSPVYDVLKSTKQAAFDNGGSHLSEMRNHSCYK